MKTCYIFGAAQGLPDSFQKENDDLVIAADAGLIYLERLGIKPDIALGDFDSLGYVPICEEVIKHPVMKNDTDTMLAVKTGLSRGYSRFVLFGCSGKRQDHTIANFQTLAYISNHSARGFLVGDEFTASVVTDDSIAFSEKANGTISVFSMVEKSSGVYERGLLYSLDNADVTFDFPIGQSNEFTGVKSTVEVKNGSLLIMWTGTIDDVCSC